MQAQASRVQARSLGLATVTQVLGGTRSVTDVADEYLGRADVASDRFGAFTERRPDLVVSQAANIDLRLSSRPDRITTPGLLVAVKDTINTIDYTTTMGSDLWTERGHFDARVVATMRDAGAVIVGKTKTAEFGVHDAPKTLNPRDVRRIPGTSSTGSAVAVATGLCHVALATQTAGSISRPASYCSVLGLKPTFGLIPRTGVLKSCDDFDTVGLMAMGVKDLSLALRICLPDASNHPISNKGLSTAHGWEPRTLLVPSWYGDRSIPQGAAQNLEPMLSVVREQFALSVDVLDISLDVIMAVREAHAIIYAWNVFYYLGEELSRSRRNTKVKALMEEGRRVTRDELEAARRTIECWRDLLDGLLSGDVALLEPSTAGPAPLASRPTEPPDNNLLWTAAGVPTLSLPALWDPHSHQPFNAQLVAPRYSDFGLLEFASKLTAESVGAASSESGSQT
jgi:Asp-tRNA(Asn)/Glu-tRNA(Gln) amidotransferase A subunit family amidase